ncbi:MAG: PIN domain-containing protein, partial [Holophagales bacterium]|nr:PIN domain-containing protein [Holophagales bacterium]
MRYLLDTNILSEPMKTSPDPGLMVRLARHRSEVCTAAPVWHELLFGVQRLPRSKRRHRLE